ncbi:MAG: MMPL family transporter [Acidimicrobiia bacterium]|nr:MMPL family transporter [Acidimicrobiia bacterium]
MHGRTQSPQKLSLVERMSAWSVRRRRRVIVLWVVVLVAFNAVAASIGSQFTNAFSLPGTESQEAFDILEERFPERSGDTAEIVFKAEGGIEDAGVRSRMEDAFGRIEDYDEVVAVLSPYGEGGTGQMSPEGTIAFAVVQFEGQAGDIDIDKVKEIKEIAESAAGDGLTVEVGGFVVAAAEQEPPGLGEAIGFFAAMIILLIAFGSLLAMVLPLVIAMFGIGVGLTIMTVLTHVLKTPQFAPQLASMIGIAVGIDYALFIVTRYREGLEHGMEPEEAIARSSGTAGRAVVFAGVIVVISMLGMLLMRFQFVEGLAVGAATVVFVTMVASATLLPALLGFTGRNIDKFHIPFFAKRQSTDETSIWFRWSRRIQRHPGLFATMSFLVLVLLATPVFSMRLGVADAGNDPKSHSTRRAYDLLSEGFGPGSNGHIILVASLESSEDLDALEGLRGDLEGTEGIVAVGPAVPNEAGDAAVVNVTPAFAPQDVETSELVDEIRTEIVPRALAGSGAVVRVGGFTAIIDDFSRQIAQRLPVLIGVVLALSFLLLMVVFRSVLVPLKAAVMNLLSIGAAYGVIVAIFQWGWFADEIGVGRPGPIEAWIPMMLFAILFGLSMDYEVFLLSRVREEYLRTNDNALAVANGLAKTARVITAAALIMVTVFLSFVLSGDLRQVKLFGIGLAVAVLIDVTLVRVVLVPSTMELLGDANWWLPRWLDRLLPTLRIEAEEAEEGEHEGIDVRDPAEIPEEARR